MVSRHSGVQREVTVTVAQCDKETQRLHRESEWQQHSFCSSKAPKELFLWAIISTFVQVGTQSDRCHNHQP